ncbi:hypothetical protein [uncultured Sunxiuqinia sp.]|uniref:hypothetical protein n=1 Tax=uncultured Sunxiuqinia sp. TaxID=1573825 RepID=UPI00260B87DD|nr:hypothetical protein [uncultured Sunxiuqinia sp.]
MKKQILFLTFLVLAVFAGTNSFGQLVLNTEEDYLDAAPTCTPAIPLTCLSTTDELSPVAGVPYTYEITVSSSESIHWFVTDDTNIMTGQETFTGQIDLGDASGNYLLSSDASYNDPANTSASVTLTWKSFDAATNTVLLVAYAVDAAGCTDNIEVYRIVPQYSFTLDIAGLLDDGTIGATECVAPVQDATYDAANDLLTVTYGTNYVFFTVNAANWQTSWMPDNFIATSTDANSTLGTPEWAYPDEATTGGTWRATDGTAQVEASHYDETTGIGGSVDGFVGQDGACIVVRVQVDHGSTTETLTDETINLVVNGEMINPATSAYDGEYPDLEELNDANVACESDLTSDNADYTITARPDIDEVDPTPFEDKTPNGD